MTPELEKAAREPSQEALDAASSYFGETADEFHLLAEHFDDFAKAALSSVLLNPSAEAVQIVDDALSNFVPLNVRRNKARAAGEQWEVVQIPPDDEPLSDENVRIVGAYATSDEAHAVASNRNAGRSVRDALRALAAHLGVSEP